MSTNIPLKVLFADDDDAFRFVLHSVLKDAGFDATSVENGEKAIEALKTETFDVIVLDYKMGEVSGLNVLQWIHEQKITTPVIMVTAAGTETVAVEAMKLGAYDYVRKEHIEIDHFELMINAVHERYLFRKEREDREIEQRQREKNRAALEMHQNTAEAFTDFLTNSLTVLSMRMDEFSRDILPLIKEENKEFFTSSFNGLRQDLSVLSSALASVVNLTKVVTNSAATLINKTTAPEEIVGQTTENEPKELNQK